ncbi:hypothetical protein WJX74_005916 [Apatococcus lobatus]|uniref:Uncharacterized protein n=1 Tax=Apatococcus lobatus TaxID=904363 RepID=A0AAW1S748_9CHLO
MLLGSKASPLRSWCPSTSVLQGSTLRLQSSFSQQSLLVKKKLPGRAAKSKCLQRSFLPVLAVGGDPAPPWTIDQIAGLIFGASLLAIYLSLGKVDEWVARSQRQQMGLCPECGGLNEPKTCEEKKCPYRLEARHE